MFDISTRSDENWSLGSEGGSVSSSWCSFDVSDLWIFKRSFDVLSSLFSHDSFVLLDNSLDNMNTFTSGTVSTSQFTVQL